jgi:hypothetical protein
MVIGFLFNRLVDGVIRKLFGVERQSQENGKWFDKCDLVKWGQVSFDAWFVERIHCHHEKPSKKMNSRIKLSII